MSYARQPTSRSISRIADAAPVPLWLDNPLRPEPLLSASGLLQADLAVVGAGYTGLWTALLAKEADPDRDVVVLEATSAGEAASGRNGGFCSASLTHGLGNGAGRFAAELPELLRLGAVNLDAIETAVDRYQIQCDFERTDELSVATEPHHIDDLHEHAELAESYDQDATFLDQDEIRSLVDSPLYLAGLRERGGNALLDPARLVWGLRAACLRLGVRIYENSPVTGIETAGPAMLLRTAQSSVRSARVALATNAFPPLLRRLRNYLVPVWDYVIATEPLPADVRKSLRWESRQGVSDVANQFHYYRLTSDDRIVFGGYDAVYHRGNGFGPHLQQRPETFALLAEHLVETFPQLADVAITHTWGGAIDTCSRFSPFWGTAHAGRLAYVAGFTGLGVGASRFGAQVMLDLLDARKTARTSLSMVTSKPLPFPPEPLRSLGIGLTQRAYERSDRNGGRRGPWLRVLDRVGMGFDS